MKLVNSTPSAFGRKVAIALKEKSIPFEMVMDVLRNDKATVPQHSPQQEPAGAAPLSTIRLAVDPARGAATSGFLDGCLRLPFASA